MNNPKLLEMFYLFSKYGIMGSFGFRILPMQAP